jgi:peroxiredoxin Q/BCP
MRLWTGVTPLGWLFAGLAVLTGGTTLAAQEKKTEAAQEKKIEVEVGDTAPVFEATDDKGILWKSADHVGKKYVVVYFYPGDFTPGCIRQAQSFRDNMNTLNGQGIEVIGISGDSANTHALFKAAQKLNFTLLADENGNLAKSFGVPVGAGGEVRTKDADGKNVVLKRGVTTVRWTFILGKDGKIIYKNTRVNPVDDSKQIAAFIEKLEKK